MKEKQVPMMKSNAAVAGLNKVAGFDPVKLLNSALSKKPADKDEAARLNLRFKKLWFRLVCPQGRIRLSALRLTDQLAIIEARIFLHKDDPEPVANFTAERRAQDTPLYIQAAQYEAQDNALTDAGFGIQLCDVCQATGEEAYTSREPAPVGAAETPQAQAAVEPAPEAIADTPAAPLLRQRIHRWRCRTQVSGRSRRVILPARPALLWRPWKRTDSSLPPRTRRRNCLRKRLPLPKQGWIRFRVWNHLRPLRRSLPPGKPAATPPL